MMTKGGLKFLALISVSAGLTAGLFFLDQYRATHFETAAALRWARQVAAQVESMELSARSRAETDPLAWALTYLSQGVEPRLVTVRRLASTESSVSAENFQLDRKAGLFDYSRAMNPQDHSGIRITLDLRSAGINQGFLGTHTQITEDSALSCVFVGFFFFFWSLASLSKAHAADETEEEPLPLNAEDELLRSLEEKPQTDSQPNPSAQPQLANPPLSEPTPSLTVSAQAQAEGPTQSQDQAKIEGPTLLETGASPEGQLEPQIPLQIKVQPKPKAPLHSPTNATVKSSLSSLGTEIRNLLKQTHAMTVATRTSRATTDGLRAKIHHSLSQLHSKRKLLRELTLLIGQAEILVEDPSVNQKELLVLIEKIKDLSTTSDRAFRELEIQFEPCAMDADMASETYQNAVVLAEKMNEQIEKTKVILASHIQLFQNPEKQKRRFAAVDSPTDDDGNSDPTAIAG